MASFKLPQFEKYCNQCKKFFLSDQVKMEQCPTCGTLLQTILICQTCQRTFSVYTVDLNKKCPTCNVVLKLKYG
jgi:DNA-directed RNA polymerase subunit RPC12/RpoP